MTLVTYSGLAASTGKRLDRTHLFNLKAFSTAPCCLPEENLFADLWQNPTFSH